MREERMKCHLTVEENLVWEKMKGERYGGGGGGADQGLKPKGLTHGCKEAGP